LLNASMLVFHLPISRFLSYGITPRPMARPVGRCDGMLQFTGQTSRNHGRLLKEAGAEGLSFDIADLKDAKALLKELDP